MARDYKMRFSILNFRIHPHTPQSYIDLLKASNERVPYVKIWGETAGAIASLSKPREIKGQKNVIYGYLYKFINVNTREAWVDLRNLKRVDAADDEHPVIPDYLRPGLKEILYIFFPNHHRLFFETKHLSPNRAKVFFENLFNQSVVKDEFGMVDVDIETRREVIDEILRLPRLTKLEIDIGVPNDDELSDLQDEFMEILREEKVRRYKQHKTSLPNKSITPTKTTLAAMDLATSNGKVNAVGYDEQEIRREISSSDHPYIEQITYNPERETQVEAMVLAAAAFIGR